jgi:hypothetical protein
MFHEKYIWAGKYTQAILESDPIKLYERIESARQQIDRRMQYLCRERGMPDGEEFCAIQDSLSELRILEGIEARANRTLVSRINF